MKLLITIAFSFLISDVFCQEYLDHIAEETCECMGDINDYKTYDEFSMALGLCMISEAEPFKKKLKRDFQIDFSKLDEKTGERLGQELGLRLIVVCPEFMEAFSKFDTEVLEVINEDAEEEKDIEAEFSSENSSEGIISSYDDEGFLSIKVEKEDGSKLKLLWLDYVETDFDLDSGLDSLNGLKVKVSYVKKEFYDLKSNEYRYYKVLTSLETDD